LTKGNKNTNNQGGSQDIILPFNILKKFLWVLFVGIPIGIIQPTPGHPELKTMKFYAKLAAETSFRYIDKYESL